MKWLNLTFILLISCSCSQIGLRPQVEYKITSSRKGTIVKSLKGRTLGETPLYLHKKDLKESINGAFIILYLQKDGYIPRVLMLDANKSINAMVNLEQDKNFKKGEKHYLNTTIKQLQKKLGHIQSGINQNRKLIGSTVKLFSNKETQKNKPFSSYYKNVSPQKRHKKHIIKTVVKKFPIQEILIAQYYIISGDLKRAQKKLFDIEEKHPNVSEVYSMLAYIEINIGNNIKAKSYLDKAFKINKNDLLAQRLRQAI
jgi:tetratricopeptide (TPR) repeat protein